VILGFVVFIRVLGRDRPAESGGIWPFRGESFKFLSSGLRGSACSLVATPRRTMALVLGSCDPRPICELAVDDGIVVR
jgi:hypothetical protein